MILQCDSQVCVWRDLKKEEAFVLACWEYKRRHRTEEPTADEFGLLWPLAEALARQVQAEFERKVISELLKNKVAA